MDDWSWSRAWYYTDWRKLELAAVMVILVKYALVAWKSTTAAARGSGARTPGDGDDTTTTTTTPGGIGVEMINSVTGAGAPVQTVEVQIPAGIEPGMKFSIQVGKQQMAVECPAGAVVGQTLQVGVPAADAPPAPPPLPRPGVVEVQIPADIEPGMKFTVQAGEQQIAVECPAGAVAGQTLQVAVPAANVQRPPQDMAAGALSPGAASSPAGTTAGINRWARVMQNDKENLPLDICLLAAVDMLMFEWPRLLAWDDSSQCGRSPQVQRPGEGACVPSVAISIIFYSIGRLLHTAAFGAGVYSLLRTSTYMIGKLSVITALGSTLAAATSPTDPRQGPLSASAAATRGTITVFLGLALFLYLFYFLVTLIGAAKRLAARDRAPEDERNALLQGVRKAVLEKKDGSSATNVGQEAARKSSELWKVSAVRACAQAAGCRYAPIL